MKLLNKTVVVAGTGSGIGQACALLFAREGADVVLIARNKLKLEAIVKKIQDQGREGLAIQADLTQKIQVQQAFDAVAARFKKVDVLLCNCGNYSLSSVEKMSEADWDSMLNANLKSYFLSVQSALPMLSESAAGSIILTAAVFGHSLTLKNMAHYNASKSAVMAFGKTLALELAEKNIRVNTLCPGQISHQIADEKNLMPQPKILRAGTPEDVAQAALFFASAQSGWVSGSVLTVDGGLSLGLSAKE